ALANPTPPESSKPTADGDEPNDSATNPTSAVPINGLNAGETVEPNPAESPSTKPTADQIAKAKAAYNKAKLLHATYLALSGRAAEAKQQFQSVFAEGSGADTVVRVNALIKSACLSMSVDQ
ncbi:hypothetical protein T265_15899, partial [Opisthorchis viverrini]